MLRFSTFFLLLTGCLLSMALSSHAQVVGRASDDATSDVISRVFSAGTGPLFTVDGTTTSSISRVFSAGVGELYTEPEIDDAIARAFSVGVGDLYLDPETTDAIARQFSIGIGEIYEVGIDDAIARQFSVNIPEPNLVATSVGTSDTLTADQTFTVSWTVENQGEESPEDPWSDSIYLSKNDSLGPEDLLLGTLPRNPPLDPGNSYSDSLQATIPIAQEYPAGTYYMILYTDPGERIRESEEGDNILVSNMITLERPPFGDLVVSNVNTPSDGEPGQQVTVNWTTTNGGSLAIAGTWNEQIVATLPSVPNYTFLLKVVSLSTTLDPSESIARSTPVTLPDLPADEYTLTVITNSDNGVLEESTENNSTTSLSALFNRPDLVPSNVTGPTTAEGDETVTVNWDIDNNGTADATLSWTDAIRLAPEAGGDGVLLADLIQIPPLTMGGQFNSSTDVVIPGDLPDGNYRFVVEANFAEDFTETGPDNNRAEAAALIAITQPPRPNLIVSSITLPPGGLGGEQGTVEWVVENIGPRDSTETITDRVYLVGQNSPEVLVAEILSGTPLPSGNSELRSTTITYPYVFDDYQVRIETDALDLVNEGLGGGEDDNETTSAGTFMVDSYTVTAFADIEEEPAPILVNISGSAAKVSDSLPAMNVPVSIDVDVQGTTRTFGALTDGNGDYTLQFSPLRNEGGQFSLRGGPPGYPAASPTDTFIIHGMRADRNTPNQILVEDNGQPTDITIVIRNNGDVPQNGLSALLTLPPSLTGEVKLSSTDLPALGFVDADVRLEVNNARSSLARTMEDFSLNVESSQGASTNVEITADIRPPDAQIESNKSALTASVVRSSEEEQRQEFVSFTLTNIGSAATGPIAVNIPAGQDLFSLTTMSPLPSLEPNESTKLYLRLSAASDFPLGEYTGTVFISAEQGNSFNIPYVFRVLSDETGDLEVSITDEFTYWDSANGFPLVEGATVKVLDGISKSVVAEDATTSSGIVLFQGLREGFYIVEASAPRHQGARQSIFVDGDTTTELELFLARSVVTYEWNVTPVAYEDRYRVDIDAVFETNVPAPVVTIEPGIIDLDNYVGTGGQINFTITNHGLIQADAVELRLASTERWRLTPLVEDIGDLPAMTSVIVPVLIEDRLAVGGTSRFINCKIPAVDVKWELVCGIPRPYSARVAVRVTNDDCGDATGSPLAPPPLRGEGGTFSHGEYDVIQAASCDPCTQGFIECAIGCLPGPFGALGCTAGFVFATRDCAFATTTRDRVRCILGGSSAILGCSPAAPAGCALCLLLAAENCYFLEQENQARAAGVTLSSARRYLLEHVERVREYYSILNVLYGLEEGEEWYQELSPDETEDVLSWLARLTEAMDEGSQDEFRISSGELTELLEDPAPSNLSNSQIIQIAGRWNRTVDYYELDIYEVADVPSGESIDFIPWSEWVLALNSSVDAMEKNFDEGFEETLEGLLTAAEVFSEASESEPVGVCARVVIRISQDVVLSRAAFEAQLILTNEGSTPLENLQVSIFADDIDGNDATSLFGILDPVLSGISALDGTESLASSGEVDARWTLIPSDAAAPTGETSYAIRGQMSYVLDGNLVEIPLFPVSVTVLPNPQLELDYFLVRDVYSDDPFTPEVEPAEPFDLGLLVRNTGAGEATNLEIISSQPQIIENEKGLLVSFEIIGSRIGTEDADGSLTADIGDLLPGNLESVRWFMTSSLQGEFVEYEATFQHLSELGDEQFSIIKRVDIHPLTRAVFATFPSDDGRFDFLADDSPDLLDLPETLYLTDGSIQNVVSYTEGNVLQTPTIENPVAQISVDVNQSGFVYIRLDDPSEGEFELTSVQRISGAVNLPDENSWQTVRNIRLEGQPTFVESRIHLFDYISESDLNTRTPLIWELTYEERAPEPVMEENWFIF